MKRANPRTRARSWVLHIMYGWDVAGDLPLDEWARQAMRGRNVSPRYRPYIERLLEVLQTHLPECDRRIETSMPNWRLERLAAIDRNILRMAVVEMLAVEDVPDTVAIHEAIRLAEKYGSDDSPGFVNGVLDAVSRRVAAEP
jgi:N utilization substance protein B